MWTWHKVFPTAKHSIKTFAQIHAPLHQMCEVSKVNTILSQGTVHGNKVHGAQYDTGSQPTAFAEFFFKNDRRHNKHNHYRPIIYWHFQATISKQKIWASQIKKTTLKDDSDFRVGIQIIDKTQAHNES